MDVVTDDPRRTSPAALRERLVAFIETLDVNLGEPPDDDSPLVGSRLLDSLALLRLAVWIEAEVGHLFVPETFDLREEWKTVGSVVPPGRVFTASRCADPLYEEARHGNSLFLPQ